MTMKTLTALLLLPMMAATTTTTAAATIMMLVLIIVPIRQVCSCPTSNKGYADAASATSVDDGPTASRRSYYRSLSSLL